MQFKERSKANPFTIEDSGIQLYFNDGISEYYNDEYIERHCKYWIYDLVSELKDE